MKKIDPTKNVVSVAVMPTAVSKAGIGPIAKQVGADREQQPDPPREPARASVDLRCRRADHSTTSPSAPR